MTTQTRLWLCNHTTTTTAAAATTTAADDDLASTSSYTTAATSSRAVSRFPCVGHSWFLFLFLHDEYLCNPSTPNTFTHIHTRLLLLVTSHFNQQFQPSRS